MRLREQVVVVTGANGAVGSVLIDYLKSRAEHVVGCLRGASVDWRPAEDHLSYVTCNLADKVAVNFMVAEILRHLESCHAWINVAGGFSLDGWIEEVSPEAWKRMFDLNFITCLNACQAIWLVFKDQDFGRIINFGSIAGDMGMAQASPYAVSKAAVHNLTHTLAQEGGNQVTSNLIIPSIIDTQANREAMPDADFSTWTDPEAIAEKIAAILDQADQPPNGEKYYF
ncbi:MAG: SDR family NAD(P)-dependent oxidoreductase [Fidelibacterota bacterium]|nr:MAG: SDR family NAD(P)-dependent oxidoreductase [Candidatus Neomarinimicrobiota bacterium]